MISANSKIFVIGTSGSGKSTLAWQLAKKLNIPDIELDALFWKANWTESSPEEFREKVTAAIQNSSAYVMHGNYNKISDLTWGNADTIIWLDYSKVIVMFRVIRRSLRRIISQEALWAENKESFRKTFLTKQSIILWAWNTYELRKSKYQNLINSEEFKNKKIIVFKTPKETERFLNEV